jgi:hypothetical protein
MSTGKVGRRAADGFSLIYPGADLSAEAVEFGAAIDRYKRLARRPFPTLSEVLEVALALGYRRVAEPTPPPARKAVRK